MKVHKTRWFENWAINENVSDQALLSAIEEKEVSKRLLSYTDKEIQHAVKEDVLFEVKKNDAN